jgi:hypothetical protein
VPSGEVRDGERAALQKVGSFVHLTVATAPGNLNARSSPDVSVQLEMEKTFSLTGVWVPNDTRDQILDFVWRWSEKTEIGAGRFIVCSTSLPASSAGCRHRRCQSVQRVASGQPGRALDEVEFRAVKKGYGLLRSRWQHISMARQ